MSQRFPPAEQNDNDGVGETTRILFADESGVPASSEDREPRVVFRSKDQHEQQRKMVGLFVFTIFLLLGSVLL